MADIRALLLTDVVDSTRLAHTLGDAAMAEVWTAHDRAARDLLPAWRGREIDKTDGMLLMFDSAADAVSYALAYHDAIAGLPVPLRSRAGLHVGPVILRENSAEDVARGAKPLEVDGLAKPTAARVMGLAQGGQTLLTEEARAALHMPDGCSLQSHGHWMLKGLADPVELFEVGAAAAAFETPPDSEKAYRVARVGDQWLPVQQIPNNLPQQITSFVGRERERREVRAAMERSRLVTLLGMGGLGKTRLSLQVAAEAMAGFPDGAWFLDLAPLRDPALVAAEAAQLLGVREEPGQPLVQTLGAALKARRALLVFDNCEHLIDACARLADAILRAAPQVRILASSREALRVPGEQAYPVLPLPLPARGDGVEALSRSTAVRLFVERALAHKPAFALTEREAPAVAELVSRLEGIPLALELAAARVRAMSVADINARLKDRYKLLTGGGRVLLERQQTLRALVDWSYDMLGENERTVLMRLAVFAGGWDLEAAEAVCGAEPLEPFDVLDLLTSLVEKSLVMTEERDEGTRYRMLETIRDYAREKLKDASDLAPAAVRHCQHYFAFAKAVKYGLQGPEQASWIRRMETELDNVRAGIATAMAGDEDPIIAVKYAVAMQPFWIMRGYASEGRAVIRSLLNVSPVSGSDLAMGHTLYVGAALAESQSDYAQAQSMLEQCLALRRGLGNPIDIAGTLSTLALIRLATGNAEAAREGETEALALFRAQRHAVGEAIVLLQLGQVHAWSGELAQARACLADCLSLARKLGHREVEAECELVIGEIEFESGDLERAGERFLRSLAISHEAADKRGEANALWWQAKVDLDAHRFDAARERLTDALQAFRAFEMRKELLGCLEDCVVLAYLCGRHADAVGLAGGAQQARDRLQLIRSPNGELRWREFAEALCETMDGAAYDAAWHRGAQGDLESTAEAASVLLAAATRPD